MVGKLAAALTNEEAKAKVIKGFGIANLEKDEDAIDEENAREDLGPEDGEVIEVDVPNSFISFVSLPFLSFPSTEQ